MNYLYLVRHGENIANLTREFSHRRVDYDLTPKGVLQAQQTAEYFKDKPVDAIYSSPLKRAQQTAAQIAHAVGLPVQVLETLREVNVGDLEGEPATEALWRRHNLIIADWMAGKHTVTFPNGEDYLSLLGRFHASIAQMTAGRDGKHMVVVGHGGMFTFTLKDLCGVDVNWLAQQQNHNCAITTLVVESGNGHIQGQLVQWACVDHLHGPAADFVPGMVRTDH